MAKEAYKGHVAGSNKGKVHKAYDEGGAKKAMRIGLALGLNIRTVQNCISEFGGVGGTRSAAKKTVKKTAKVAKKAPAAKKAAKAVKKAAAKKAPAVKKTVKKTVKKAPKRVAKEPKSTIVTDVVTHG